MSDIKDTINNSPLYGDKVSLIRSPLLNRAKAKIFNKEDAEDVVQNTINIIINKESDYNKSKNFYGWAFTILHWQIKGYITSQKRNREDKYYSEDSLAYSLSVVENKRPFDDLLKKELHDEQMNILNDIKNKFMPPREKEFFEYQLKGWSKPDIVYAMKLTTDSQFYVYKRRVIQRIKTNSKSYK